jgi:prepilin-type processing-associated H-X9-DG protein
VNGSNTPLSDFRTIWPTLTAGQQSGLASVPVFKCPTVRNGTQYVAGTPAGTTNTSGYGTAVGPVGDYAVVVYNNVNQDSWIGQYNPFAMSTDVTPFDQAIRLAKLDGTSISNSTTWTPRDTLSTITDGTSNTVIVGEKFSPKSYLGACCGSGATGQDNSIMYSGGGYQEVGSVGRSISYPLLTSPNITSGDTWNSTPRHGFGGWHTGTVHFLMADGAVRGIGTNISLAVQISLGRISDGAVPGEF